MKYYKVLILIAFILVITACRHPRDDSSIENGNNDQDPPINGVPSNGEEPNDSNDDDDPTINLIEDAIASIRFSASQPLDDDFSVPLSYEEVTITWSSSHPDYLNESAGQVVLSKRPLPNQDALTITLTASFSVGELTQESNYAFIVEPYHIEGRIRAIFEGEGSFPIFGVIYAFHASGYYIYDGLNTAVIYDYNFDYTYGDLVMIEGYYYDEHSFSYVIPTFAFEVTKSEVLEHNVIADVPITVIGFDEFMTIDFFDPYKLGSIYEVTGRLDTEFLSFNYINDLNSFNRIRLFPQMLGSQLNDLRDQAGERVTIPVIAHRYRLPDGVEVSYDSQVKAYQIIEQGHYTRVEDFYYQVFPFEQNVLFEGLVVGGFDPLYYVYDGTNILAVHRSHFFTTTIDVGDRVRFTGSEAGFYYARALYYSSYEVIEKDQSFLLESEAMTIEELYDTLDIENPLSFNQLYTFEGKIIESGIYGKLYLQSLNSQAYLVLDAFIMSSAAFAILESYLDQDVEVELLVNTYTFVSTGEIGNEFKMAFFGDPEKIRILPLSDQLILQSDLDDLTLNPNLVYQMNILLPSSGSRGTLYTDWQSSHPEIIAHDGTFVALPNEDTWVTFTMTAVYQTASEIYQYSVLAKAEPDSVKEVLATELNKEVVFEGLVISHDYYEYGYFVQDLEGYAIFVEASPSDYHRVEFGQRIIIHGTRSLNTEHNNQEPRVINSTIIELIEGDFSDTLVVIDHQSLNAILASDDFYARRYRVYTVEIDYTFSTTVRLKQEEGHLDPVYQIYFMSDNLESFDGSIGSSFAWIEFTVSRYYHNYGLFVSGVTYQRE